MAKSFSTTGTTIVDTSADIPTASAAYEGVMVFQKDTNELKICDGASWVSVVDTDTPSGLVLINTTSFSGSSAIVFNNVFSSAYDNYRIMYHFTSDTAATMNVVMRVGGVSTSGGTDYAYSRAYISGTSAPANNGGSTGAAFGVFASTTTNASGHSGFWDVFRPALTQRTQWVSLAVYATLGEWGYINHNQAVAYDGFELTGGGTRTGTIRVYGYRNSI